ncbi:YlmC/YmxH family sporulation protein [Thalassobacillus sp. CUG 92003]|uniref:YlmC/YmxH family sporulation protein n=1 Tax=Thalassobacillus sp. CUG 92003 TaxID=2736641 RepID=UPI0015E7DA44|nr:YlmC/YmxH family sporulation protein [Thalassobacillus sp. CUG 92003]
MRFKQLAEKEVVDVTSGSKLGMLGQADLEINPETGEVETLIIPAYKWMGMKATQEGYHIRWQDIVTIGSDMILIQHTSTESNG